MSTIKAIIFDCFGVFYLDPTTHFMELARQQGGDSAEELRSLTRQADLGYITPEAYNQGIARLIGVSHQEIMQLRRKGLVRHQAVLDFAQSLRPKYKVGLLSNVGAQAADNYFTPSEREKYFDVAVLSGEVGLVKPEPEIFRLTCSRLDVRPEEAVLIDDNEANCAGAEDVGMKAIVFTDVARLKHDVAQVLSRP